MTVQDRTGFDALTFLAKAVQGRAITNYDKNQTIYSQGDPADAVYYIQSGTVLSKVISCQGKEAIIGILSDGDFFGEGCLAGQPRRTSTAATLSKCTIVRLERSAMQRLLRDEPPFSGLFIQYLLSRNLRIEEDLVDHFFNYSEKRLARVLIRLTALRKRTQSERSIPKITQSMLAEIVGTTRARVSFFMNRFRKLGFIDYNPGLHIYSSLEKFVLSSESPEPDAPSTTPAFEEDSRPRIPALFARAAADESLVQRTQAAS